MKEKPVNIYVIALDEAVLSDKKFSAMNPNYIEGKPCVYVGSTALTPDERFQRHKDGIKANKYVFNGENSRAIPNGIAPLSSEIGIAARITTAASLLKDTK